MSLHLSRRTRVALRHVTWVGSLALALTAAALLAQQPIFRASVDYVRLDVVVTDDKDRPVLDLTKNDFEVFESGVVQELRDFRVVVTPGTSVPAHDSRSSAPIPDVVANVVSPQGRLFVLVIDDLHIIESELLRVKRVMTEFFDTLSVDDEVAVVFVRHSHLSQNFTNNRARLRNTADRLRAALGFGLDALGRSGTEFSDPRTMLIFAQSADSVLKNVALSLEGAPQARRAIIYVTSGSVLPTTPNPGNRYPNDHEFLLEVYDTARRAGVPIYTIDPRGLVQPAEAIRGGGTGIDSQGPAPTMQRSLIVSNIRQQQTRLAEIAVATGGLSFTNQSDLSRAVRAIVEDNNAYYLLGYYPTPAIADGKFHPVRVTVKRPGLKVRSRQGYLAAVPPSSEGRTGDGSVLGSAMRLGVNVSAIQLRAVATPLLPTDKGMKTLLTVEVLYPEESTGAREVADDLLFSVIALDVDGKVKASVQRPLSFKATTPERGAFSLLINDIVDLPDEQLILRLGVASRSMGKAGTVQLDLNLPSITRGRLQLAGPVIGRKGTSPSVLNAVPVTAVTPFQPVTERSFSPSDVLNVLCHAAWSSGGPPSVTARLVSATGSRSEPMTLSGGGAGLRGGFFTASVPLAGLPVGPYVLEVLAKDAERTVVRQVPITVK